MSDEFDLSDPADLKAAAERGNAFAQCELAARYATGEFGAADLAAAAGWYAKAAAQDMPQAQYEIGSMYLQGEGVAKDQALGRKWLEAAAANGMEHAMEVIAAFHELGLHGFPRDPAMAVRWYQASIDRGSSRAKLCLGKLYLEGEIVPKDEAKGLRLIEESRDEGFPRA